ncbi:hypothetical protein M408DRAFT_30005 [Serendipita vermifera MAFF 305830]|uniref:Uncharacterized protein n=1 Tax=Serendipita vermifera MAFF 305830 TaxID=933852 RepID=A0A0C3ANL2_SERVB|nr:hypothetical protein M408DRAFT_30005 [Serendipita vermifera MAFF 305830]
MVSYQGDTKYLGREMIAVAFDIGTTSSAVSYTYLYPDDYARVRMVTKWPGQPISVGSSKIPTLVAYRNGQYKACGAEALDYVDDSHYDVAKWFKLHLHPSSMKRSNQPPPYSSVSGSAAFEVPALPPSIEIGQIYTDFMNGDMKAPEEYNGCDTHYAKWLDFEQQSFLREAALEAGVVSKENSYEPLEFVTEGEASVHYALAYSQSKSWLAADTLFAVIDAGGSTVDGTLYECKSTEPKVVLEEARASECIQYEYTRRLVVFVDRAAETMMKQKLAGSKYGDDDYIMGMVAAFESRTKRLFDGEMTNYAVEFGTTRDNDRPKGIIKGRLSLTMNEISSTFEDVIQRIVNSCLVLLCARNVKYVLLVGGFGESIYLQKELTKYLKPFDVIVVTVEEQTKKAAA